MKRAVMVTLALAVSVLFSITGPLSAGASAGGRSASGPVPAPPGLTSAEVSFKGFGGLTLHGSVLAPAKARGPVPGVVLVTGSGAGVPREHLRTEAVEFARRGLAVLIYDKRSEGYSNLRRSYSELADDVLGAVGALRARPGVDPGKVGVWGLSEGGWVAPLAASRSADVAFVIVVGGNAMPPIRQQTWNETSGLRRAGVRGSLVDRAKPGLARLGADAGLFAEAFFDAQGVLERVRQPLLGVWGGRDLQTPPEDNPRLFARALRRGGNARYTFRFFPGADHAAHVTSDGGETRGEALAPGYADFVVSWVRAATGGALPAAPAAFAAPEGAHQDYPSKEISPSPWWASGWTQLGSFVLFVVAFTGYPLTALVRRLRGRTVRPASRWARLASGAGLTAVLGLFFYLVYLMAAGRWPDPGPVVAGRPLPWLALQALAVATVAATAVTAVAARTAWRSPAAAVATGERVRIGLLVAAGAVFVPWALYWGLLVP